MNLKFVIVTNVGTPPDVVTNEKIDIIIMYFSNQKDMVI